MGDTRYKNIRWKLPGIISWSQVPVALLMDLRDELQQINRTLQCRETLSIPRTLRRIARAVEEPTVTRRRRKVRTRK